MPSFFPAAKQAVPPQIVPARQSKKRPPPFAIRIRSWCVASQPHHRKHHMAIQRTGGDWMRQVASWGSIDRRSIETWEEERDEGTAWIARPPPPAAGVGCSWSLLAGGGPCHQRGVPRRRVGCCCSRSRLLRLLFSISISRSIADRSFFPQFGLVPPPNSRSGVDSGWSFGENVDLPCVEGRLPDRFLCLVVWFPTRGRDGPGRQTADGKYERQSRSNGAGICVFGFCFFSVLGPEEGAS